MDSYDERYDKHTLFAFLTSTVKVQTTISSKVMIVGFVPSNCFCLLSEKEGSPFYISPFAMASQIPRSKKDALPAFHQIGRIEKQAEIHGICIPALKGKAP
eukprot:6863120-Ditylum_brightwellii.AAC.1